jgi:CheY-like chemotaxis protein
MPRVLLLDDDAAVAKAHALLLKRAGLDRIEVCGSPMVALSRISTGERFGVVLSDGQMPDLTGPDFYRRALEWWPELRHRIVFLSGGLHDADRSFIHEQGLPFFSKPLRDREACDELVAVLRRLGLAADGSTMATASGPRRNLTSRPAFPGAAIGRKP